MPRIVFLLFFVFFSLKSYANDMKLKICADDVPQVPNVFLKNDKIVGIEIDIVKVALKNKINIDIDIDLIPWSRCLYLAEKGDVDAVMSVSYSDERAKYMDYPSDAGPNEAKPCSSQFKISCYSYLVITLKSNKFEYAGKLEELPKPVRVARGYSIVPDLEKNLKNGLELSKSYDINIKKLIRDQEGSVIIFSPFLEYLKKQKKLSNKLKINKQKYAMKSYYLAFSKKSLFPSKEKVLIWKEIGNISNNKRIMNKIVSKYQSL